MTRKRGWEEPTKGPDWMDVETMMRSIGTFHSARVSVTISPLGIGAGGGLVTDVTAMFDVLPGSSIPSMVGVKGKWPCAEHSTLVTHVFAHLYDLDSAIAKMYEQKELWE